MRLGLAQRHIYYLIRHLVGRQHIAHNDTLPQKENKSTAVPRGFVRIAEPAVIRSGVFEELSTLEDALWKNRDGMDEATQRATVYHKLMTLMLS